MRRVKASSTRLPHATSISNDWPTDLTAADLRELNLIGSEAFAAHVLDRLALKLFEGAFAAQFGPASADFIITVRE